MAGQGPCMNGATCLNLPGDYNCTCAPGYEGLNCDMGELPPPLPLPPKGSSNSRWDVSVHSLLNIDTWK